MRLTGNDVTGYTANNETFDLTLNPAGTNGYLIDVYIGYTDHDETLTWDRYGNCLDDPEYNLVAFE
jgi:hypothetical protein